MISLGRLACVGSGAVVGFIGLTVSSGCTLFAGTSGVPDSGVVSFIRNWLRDSLALDGRLSIVREICYVIQLYSRIGRSSWLSEISVTLC